MIPKPSVPIWNAAEASRLLPGCKALWFLGEIGGPTCLDVSGNNRPGTLQGTAAEIQGMHQKGRYGAELSAFTASNYMSAMPAASVFTGSVWPVWQACLFRTTQTTKGTLAGAFPASGSLFYGLFVNYNANGTIASFIRDNPFTGTVIVEFVCPSNDGNYHVAMVVSSSSANHTIYFDGNFGANDTTSLGTLLADDYRIGYDNGNAAAPLTTGSIAVVAVGSGLYPDPATLAADWLSGRFSFARSQPRIFPASQLTTATLSGPTSGALNTKSTAFTVTLNQPAGAGGVIVTPSSTGASDTFSSS